MDKTTFVTNLRDAAKKFKAGIEKDAGIQVLEDLLLNSDELNLEDIGGNIYLIQQEFKAGVSPADQVGRALKLIADNPMPESDTNPKGTARLRFESYDEASASLEAGMRAQLNDLAEPGVPPSRQPGEPPWKPRQERLADAVDLESLEGKTLEPTHGSQGTDAPATARAVAPPIKAKTVKRSKPKAESGKPPAKKRSSRKAPTSAAAAKKDKAPAKRPVRLKRKKEEEAPLVVPNLSTNPNMLPLDEEPAATEEAPKVKNLAVPRPTPHLSVPKSDPAPIVAAPAPLLATPTLGIRGSEAETVIEGVPAIELGPPTFAGDGSVSLEAPDGSKFLEQPTHIAPAAIIKPEAKTPTLAPPLISMPTSRKSKTSATVAPTVSEVTIEWDEDDEVTPRNIGDTTEPVVEDVADVPSEVLGGFFSDGERIDENNTPVPSTGQSSAGAGGVSKDIPLVDYNPEIERKVRSSYRIALLVILIVTIPYGVFLSQRPQAVQNWIAFGSELTEYAQHNVPILASRWNESAHEKMNNLFSSDEQGVTIETEPEAPATPEVTETVEAVADAETDAEAPVEVTPEPEVATTEEPEVASEAQEEAKVEAEPEIEAAPAAPVKEVAEAPSSTDTAVRCDRKLAHDNLLWHKGHWWVLNGVKCVGGTYQLTKEPHKGEPLRESCLGTKPNPVAWCRPVKRS